MARPIPYDYRKKIIRDRKLGKSSLDIAQELGYSLSGVKKIWSDYQKRGELSLKTSYHNCGISSIYDSSTRQIIDGIKTGQQGAPFVYSMLHFKHPEVESPSIRTMQRWWSKEKIGRPQGRPLKSEKKVGLNFPTILGK
jgi:hypothetical protein